MNATSLFGNKDLDKNKNRAFLALLSFIRPPNLVGKPCSYNVHSTLRLHYTTYEDYQAHSLPVSSPWLRRNTYLLEEVIRRTKPKLGQQKKPRICRQIP